MGVIVTTTRLFAALAASSVPSTAGSVLPLPSSVTLHADRSVNSPSRLRTAAALCSDSV
ncbi:hypothetical protein SAMN05216246_10484 [Actinomyces denticolens]|uniref:Secreted protein n=1 Tax=Actinomyces denticolens TaxID=52767 RepID=A0ABY1I740_9ACTO|nr:hypothetical protein SAMN05216246_10484 [Actinomyces denticolens]SUU03095.1 Uncharacterised protein [Actinomyces denticolens]